AAHAASRARPWIGPRVRSWPRTAWWTALPQPREHGGAADQRTAQRRAGRADPDCEGADREERRAHHQSHCPAGTLPGLHADGEPHRRVAQDFVGGGAAAGASDEELRADIRFLKNLWSEIKARSDSSKSPALIYHDLNVVERVLRDQVSSEFSAIWVDTEQEYERILRFANRFQPGLVKRVKLYTK